MFNFFRRSDAATRSASDAETARFKGALDNVTTNVMFADENLNIVYLNRTVETMMRAAEADIRRELPNFRVDGLIGTNIDTFHRNPAHQRGLLTRLEKTFESRLKVGGRTFRIIANPVRDAAGKRIGTVVEWADLTEQLRREEQDLKRGWPRTICGSRRPSTACPAT